MRPGFPSPRRLAGRRRGLCLVAKPVPHCRSLRRLRRRIGAPARGPSRTSQERLRGIGKER